MAKMNLSKIRKILIGCLLIGVIFSGGYYLGAAGFQAKVDQAKKILIVRELPPDKANLDFSLFWRVWDTLEARYFDKSKLDRQDMVYGAISGMVSALGDPYTVFLPPKENKIIREDLSGSFEGIGIQIGFKGNQLAVIAPLPGTPAEAAGIKAGDFIVGLKDESKNIDQGTIGMTLPEAVQVIRGKAGSKVTLYLTRDGMANPFSIEIVRAKVDVPSVILNWVGDDKETAQLKLLKFAEETDLEWNKAVEEIAKSRKVKGVVLDLRNNPGGYLEGAVDIAGEFIKSGSVVVIEERSDGKKNEFRTQRIGRLNDLPLVILVNEGSASAAEILAGALKDTKRAEIIGGKTFGKGSIQEPLEINGGSGLHITVAKWLTPSGFWVNEKGLEPDVKIEDDEKTEEDEQLLKAIEILSYL